MPTRWSRQLLTAQCATEQTPCHAIRDAVAHKRMHDGRYNLPLKPSSDEEGAHRWSAAAPIFPRILSRPAQPALDRLCASRTLCQQNDRWRDCIYRTPAPRRRESLADRGHLRPHRYCLVRALSVAASLRRQEHCGVSEDSWHASCPSCTNGNTGKSWFLWMTRRCAVTHNRAGTTSDRSHG